MEKTLNSLPYGYQCKLLKVKNLTNNERKKYQKFTTSFHSKSLYGDNPYGITDTEILAIGITFQGDPVGLALACIVPVLKTSDLYSLYVLPKHRNLGIGNTLMHRLIQELKIKQCLDCFFYYDNTDPTYLYLDLILNKHGWTPKVTKKIRYQFNVLSFSPDWFSYPIKYPTGYREFLWKDLTFSEELILKEECAKGLIPSEVSPFIHFYPLEPINSLGLRNNSEVIGWVLTHRILPDKIRYSAFHVKNAHRKKGIAIKLLQESIKLQQHAKIPYADFELHTSHHDKRWVKLVEHSLAPYALSTSEVYHTALLIN